MSTGRKTGFAKRESSPAAYRNDTPFFRIIRWITFPPPQPARRFRRFVGGVIPKLGESSAWNGQRPNRLSGPMVLKFNPALPAQVRRLHPAFDPLQFFFRYPGHAFACF